MLSRGNFYAKKQLSDKVLPFGGRWSGNYASPCSTCHFTWTLMLLLLMIMMCERYCKSDFCSWQCAILWCQVPATYLSRLPFGRCYDWLSTTRRGDSISASLLTALQDRCILSADFLSVACCFYTVIKARSLWYVQTTPTNLTHFYLHHCSASEEGIVSLGVRLSRCVCVHRISLNGEGNALYPVLSS